MSDTYTASDVDSREERQRYALKNLPGRHLWRLSELAIAAGFGDKPDALKRRLKTLFGGEWKETLGTHVLFKEKQIHFETLAMREQNSHSRSLKYDEQSLADVRNIILGNKDIFSALLRSYTRRALSEDEKLQQPYLLIRMANEIFPLIESTRLRSSLSNVGVVTCDRRLWEGGGERRKFALVAEVTLELIQHGYMSREQLGLDLDDTFLNSSWSARPASTIYKQHFTAFFDDSPIATLDGDSDEADHEIAFHRRQRLRKGIPDLFKPSSIEICDLKVIMVLEVLLSMDRFNGEIEDDAASITHIRSQMYSGFSNTGVIVPLKVVGCCLQEDAIDDEALLCFTREADVRFNKNYRDIRERTMTAISRRRDKHDSELRALYSQEFPRTITILQHMRDTRQQKGEPVRNDSLIETPAKAKRTRARAKSSSSSSLPSKRQSPTAQGGRPPVTFPELAVLRHMTFVGRVADSKMSLVAAGGGLYYTGEVPAEKDMISPATFRLGCLQLKFMDDMFDAKELLTTLIRYPYAATSLCFDGTGYASNSRNSLFLNWPCEAHGVIEARRSFLGFPIAPSKGARTLAEMTLQLIRDWCRKVPGLLVRLLISLVWSNVDHAAIPEGRELSNLVAEILPTELAISGTSLLDLVGRRFSKHMMSVGGDSFHKNQLIVNSVENASFGQKRGSQTNPNVISITAQACDQRYYEANQNRYNVGTSLNAWFGGRVTIMKSTIKQRWEQRPAVMKQLLDRSKMESKVFPNQYIFPHFLIEERRLYSSSQYQRKLLSRVIQATLHPVLMLVHVNLPIDLQETFWRDANFLLRHPSKKTGFMQGLAMRDELEYLLYVLMPFWNSSDLTLIFPRVLQGIDDLKNFAIYTFKCPDSGLAKRFTVHQCVQLERARKAGNPEKVSVSPGFEVDLTRLVLEIKNPDDDDTCVQVDREDFFVKIKSSQDDKDDDGDNDDIDEVTEDMGVNVLADRALLQLKNGFEAGRESFRNWYAERFRPPAVILLLTVPGYSGACMRWAHHLVIKHRPSLAENLTGVLLPDPGNEKDIFFGALLDPSQSESRKRTSKVDLEISTVDWLERFNIFDSPLHKEIVALSHVLASSREDDISALNFHSIYPLLHQHLQLTGDMIGQTDYVAEQANSVMMSVTDEGASQVMQDTRTAYYMNVLKQKNDVLRMIRRNEDEVTKLRKEGKSVRLLPFNSKEKVRESWLQVQREIIPRYNDPELLSSVPSREELSKGGMRSFDAATILAVLKINKEKKKDRPVENLEDELRAYQESEVPGFDEKEFRQPALQESYQDAALTLLMSTSLWHKVSEASLREEVRLTLPHCHKLLFKDIYGAFESNRPGARSHWAPEQTRAEEIACEDEDMPPYCIDNCPDRSDHHAYGVMLCCDGDTCKRNWFHKKCIGLKKNPSKTKNWYCPECASLPRPPIKRGVTYQYLGESTTSPMIPFAFIPSCIWNKNEEFTRTTAKRLKSHPEKFLKRQVKGYVSVWFSGRNPKAVGLGAEVKPYEPLIRCPACKCRHAGGIRCYLSAADDDNFLAAFINPMLSRIVGNLLKEQTRKKQSILFGDCVNDGESAEEEHQYEEEVDRNELLATED